MGMLHTPSFNLGLAAGVAWKHAGREPFNPYARGLEGTPEEAFVLEILERMEERFIFPSSFFEGMQEAFLENLPPDRRRFREGVNDPPVRGNSEQARENPPGNPSGTSRENAPDAGEGGS